MTPKIVVLGSTGMLGHKVLQRLMASFPDTIGLQRKPSRGANFSSAVIDHIDAANFDQLSRVLREIRPDYIVNCIGIVKQRPEAHDPIKSITINALLPHRLSALAGSWGGRLIHFSTDCVFSGLRGGYREADVSDATDLYGQTKFLGEAQGFNSLTLRTSIIGRELAGRRSLLEWFLSKQGDRVRGFKRVIWSGITTNHAADLVAQIISRYPDLSGLYQVASEPISKYELLRLLRAVYALDIEIVPDELEHCDRSMVGEKLLSAIGYRPPAWPDLLRELASDPTPYESWSMQ